LCSLSLPRRHSKEHKYRPAASPIIYEKLKDGRTRGRGSFLSIFLVLSDLVITATSTLTMSLWIVRYGHPFSSNSYNCFPLSEQHTHLRGMIPSLIAWLFCHFFRHVYHGGV
jgi:hypothetical protein